MSKFWPVAAQDFSIARRTYTKKKFEKHIPFLEMFSDVLLLVVLPYFFFQNPLCWLHWIYRLNLICHLLPLNSNFHNMDHFSFGSAMSSPITIIETLTIVINISVQTQYAYMGNGVNWSVNNHQGRATYSTNPIPYMRFVEIEASTILRTH